MPTLSSGALLNYHSTADSTADSAYLQVASLNIKLQ